MPATTSNLALKLNIIKEPDGAAIGKILQGLLAFNEKSFGTPNHSRLILAHIEDECVGGVFFWWFEPDAGIDYLFVEEKWRQRGIGRQLLRAAEEELKSNNCRQVTVSTYTNMAPDYYPRMGYGHIATIDRYLLGYDRLIFRKRLRKE